jgi:plastocyanin
VRMAQLAYSPASVRVRAGDTVVWRNSDTQPHTVTSVGGRTLGSGTLEPGKTYRHTFAKAGTYRYNCSIHPDMKGTVVASA